MTQARKDDNSVNTMLATQQADGITPELVEANPSTHGIVINDNTTGTDQSPEDIAKRDQNSVPVLLVASESDGSTPVQLYIDASGQLLVDST